MTLSLLRLLGTVAVATILVSGVEAQVLTWQFEQLYSSADGNIQFLVVHEYGNNQNQNMLAGSQLRSTFTQASHGHAAGDIVSFTFPTNLPSTQTGGKRFLIGTQGFTDLGIITPDYVIPNRFMSSAQGTLSIFASIAQPYDLVAYPGLPSDGRNAIYRDGGQRQNFAVNFAGQMASVGGIYSVSPLDLSNRSAAGGSATITVTHPNGVPPTATSYQAWVTVTGVTTNGGTSTVALLLSANGGAPRATSIRVADRLFHITQLGP